MFGANLPSTRRLFISAAAERAGVLQQLGVKTPGVSVRNTRSIGKRDMIRNDATPAINVDPETFNVFVDGELATCEPAARLPMAQRYFLF
jgi:urease subunit alpha